MRQKYEVQVRDAYVLAGNTGMLRCEIPSFVKEYVAVTSWVQDSVFNIYPTPQSGKFLFLYVFKFDVFVYTTYYIWGKVICSRSTFLFASASM